MEAVYIVVPAYQEAKKIGQVIAEIQTAGYNNIVVVDDGSSDDTEAIARLAGALVARHPINRGKGAATRTGIVAALRLGADLVVTIDGDGQHNPQEISFLIAPIVSGKYDVVLGTRSIQKAMMPWYKVLQNKIANLITAVYAGIYVKDSQSGFRAYSRRACELLDTTSDSYEYESEVIRLVVLHQLNFQELPISVAYTPYSTGKLHKQDIVNGAKTLYKMLWNALS